MAPRILGNIDSAKGKPHPRWADSSFRDGDPNEKWHSRATKCAPLSAKRRHSPDSAGERANPGRGILPSLLTPIKTESAAEPNSQLYRFSPSPPASSMRYHQQVFSTDVRGSSSSASFENEHPSFSNGTSSSYHSNSSSTSAPYTNSGSTHSGSYSDRGSGEYPLSGSEDSRNYSEHYHSSPSSQSTPFCSCRSSTAANHAYIALSHQLESTIGSLRQYAHHPNNQCPLYRRIAELHGLLQ